MSVLLLLLAAAYLLRHENSEQRELHGTNPIQPCEASEGRMKDAPEINDAIII